MVRGPWRRWTEQEDEILLDLASVVKYAVIADSLETRTPNQVRARMQYLGIRTRPVGETEFTKARRRELTNRWKYNNRMRSAELEAERREKMIGTYSRQEIFERDEWICQLCLEPVSQEPLPRNDPMEPTIEHVICLADGGPDTKDNVVLAHRVCNQKHRPEKLKAKAKARPNK